jgi:hypothetical protein
MVAHQAIREQKRAEEAMARANLVDDIRNITNDSPADAATMQLVRSIVENAERLGLVWKLRPGTIATSAANETPRVILDGSNQPIRCMSLFGPMMVGTRVITVLSPPSGCHVIGMIGLSGWRVLSLAGGWTGNARCRTIPSPPNAVQLYLRIAPGTKLDGTTIFTLPDGFRPKTSGVDVVVAVSAMAGATAQSPHLYINTSGNVSLYGCGNTSGLNLDGWFTTDNGGI